MKKLFLVFFWAFSCSLSANTYLAFYVNGLEADTMTQGQTFSWEMDVSEPGNKIQMQIFEDLNNDQVLDEGDRILDFFYQKDGENDPDEGVGDSDGTANGIIHSDFGVFGFVTGNYLFKVVDEDGSYSTIPFHSQPIDNGDVVQVIEGHVILNDIIPPAPEYAGAALGVLSENGMWMALTDTMGIFQLRLPYILEEASLALMLEYSGGKEYVSNFEGMYIVTGGLDTFTIDEGIYAERANARVYGTLLDGESGLPLGKYAGVHVAEAFEADTERRWYADPAGNYEIYTHIEQTMEMYLNLDDDDIYPEHMMLAYWFDESPYRFPLAPEQYDQNIDILIYPADTSVFIRLEWNDGEVDSFFFAATSNELFSVAMEYTNQDGYAVMPVYSGVTAYWTFMDNWETPVPDGYELVPVEGQNTFVGDTAYFYFLPPIGISEEASPIKEYHLKQNFPNPFNPVTTIEFTLPANDVVTLSIYNMLGEKIRTLIDRGQLEEGVNRVVLDASGLASGIYFYSLETPSFKQTRKMMVIK